MTSSAIPFQNPSRLSRLLNPFEHMTTLRMSIMAVLVVGLISYLGTRAQTQFPGLFDCLRNSVFEGARSQPSPFLLAYQVLVSAAILSALYAIACFIVNRRANFISIFSAVTFARYPYILLSGVLAIFETIEPQFLETLKEQAELPALPMATFTLVVSMCVLWQAGTYFYALKHALKAQGQPLYVAFTFTIILGELISNMVLLSL